MIGVRRMQVHLEELVKGGSYKQRGHRRATERVKASPAPIHPCPNSDLPSGEEEGDHVQSWYPKLPHYPGSPNHARTAVDCCPVLATITNLRMTGRLANQLEEK